MFGCTDVIYREASQEELDCIARANVLFKMFDVPVKAFYHGDAVSRFDPGKPVPFQILSNHPYHPNRYRYSTIEMFEARVHQAIREQQARDGGVFEINFVDDDK